MRTTVRAGGLRAHRAPPALRRSRSDIRPRGGSAAPNARCGARRPRSNWKRSGADRLFTDRLLRFYLERTELPGDDRMSQTPLAPAADRSRWIALVVLSAGFLMIILDQT